MIRTVSPKCVSGSQEEVGPERADEGEARRALGMQAREKETGTLSRAGVVSEMKGSQGKVAPGVWLAWAPCG